MNLEPHPLDAPPPRSEWPTQTRAVVTHHLQVSKWLVGIHGAALAALIAGAQFSNLGRLGPDEPRFWVAIVCFGIAMISVWMSLVLCLRVGGGEPIDLNSLTDEEMEEAHRQDLLKTYNKSADFFARQNQLLRAWQHVNDPRFETNLLVPRHVSGDVQQALLRDELLNMAWESHNLAVLIEYYRMRKRYVVAKRFVLSGLLVSTISILIATWAINPSAEERPIVINIFQATPQPTEAELPAPE